MIDTELDPTVYIVDDDESSRKSVCALVRTMCANSIAFESAEEFLAGFNSGLPGCLVTDVRLTGMSGIELQEKILDAGVTIPVVVITAHAETPLTVRAIKAGAVTVLEKPCRDYELFDAIRTALQQDADLREKMIQIHAFRTRLESLTEKEQQVLDFMIEGVPNKVIAKRLDVSVRTVENRRQRVFEKTGVESLAELVRLTVELQFETRR